MAAARELAKGAKGLGWNVQGSLRMKRKREEKGRKKREGIPGREKRRKRQTRNGNGIRILTITCRCSSDRALINQIQEVKD